MERVQRCAVRLFAEEGFAQVSVERVAHEAEVSPVSVYRWFGTKERLVLWDEYDPAILEAVAERLEGLAPLEAVRAAVVSELDRVYDADRDLVLARTKLIHREPALLAAARDDARLLELALREVFASVGVGADDLVRCVLAAVAVSVLVVAVEAWQEHDGRVPLARFVDEGFAVLAEGT
jgi:AcrR family transcriptional regulator